ncbi:hypothetical protein DVH07_18285 [Hafnia paralvei]|uniref:AvrPphF family type III effector n=1 Tax=Hafnia paralvei TaxID=546367 RepID=UPI000DF4AA96|nr:AvrPphF family type III effector [Hafnia paralvei]RDA61898.1 hypothetical protein DU449_17845 [Hafnia paralvei]RDA62959.1 hypothetical protein DVH08_20055 [Hafnia paralvei]RDA63799.1 hypothetical protein DVH09_18415 [Hafnia paralvei]RDA75085.1 hypothetical protein DVH10_17585 [Hafnia paralvei]RDA75489.1 hypothetical protein DVH07_18285 [Hafnia paralvei]
MFSRSDQKRKAFNAQSHKSTYHAIDKNIAESPFGSDYEPVLYQGLVSERETAHLMAVLGIVPDAYLVRITDIDYLDLKTMTISGHLNTVARIGDPFDLVQNHFLPELMIPKTKNSRDLNQECLNVVYTNRSVSLSVAKRMVTGYKKTTRDKVVAFKVRDVLKMGGRLYPDRSSSLENALIIGLPIGSKIPFKFV